MPSVLLLRRCRPALQKSQQAVVRMAGWKICGSGERVREAGAAIAALKPDFVACDLLLMDGHASRLAFEMQTWPRRPQLILLTPSADDLRLFEALCLGADAYAMDTGDGQGLAAGLRLLVQGRAGMTPRIAQEMLAALRLGRSSLAIAGTATAAQDLTPTGRGVSSGDQHLLSLIAHGLLAAEIASQWLMPVEAIESRLLRLYAQLHAHLRGRVPAAGANDQAAGGAVSMKLWREASFS